MKKKVRGTDPVDPVAERMVKIDLMMRRLYTGASSAELAKESGLAVRTINDKLQTAREMGVPEIARDIFMREFLPASMAVLQEALIGEDLKLATQVALKVVAGLQVMEGPKADTPTGEPESLEAWRVKFKQKPTPIEAQVVKQLPRQSDVFDEINDLSESSGHERSDDE